MWTKSGQIVWIEYEFYGNEETSRKQKMIKMIDQVARMNAYSLVLGSMFPILLDYNHHS